MSALILDGELVTSTFAAGPARAAGKGGKVPIRTTVQLRPLPSYEEVRRFYRQCASEPLADVYRSWRENFGATHAEAWRECMIRLEMREAWVDRPARVAKAVYDGDGESA